MSNEQATASSSRSSRWLTAGAWIICSLVLVAMLVGIWLRVGDERASTALASSINEGKRPVAPALDAPQIADDGAPGMPDWYEVSEGLQVGSNPGAKVMLVNWWASWCGPCREEAPDLSAIAEDYADDVVVVGVNAGGEDLMSDARAFVREMSIRFPIIRADRAMKDAWGVGGFPESFIVGTDGRISAHINGPIDDDDVRAKLDAELDR